MNEHLRLLGEAVWETRRQDNRRQVTGRLSDLSAKITGRASKERGELQKSGMNQLES